MGRGSSGPSSLAEAGKSKSPIFYFPNFKIWYIKVYGVTNTDIFEEPHYTVICDQQQVFTWETEMKETQKLDTDWK